MIFGDAAINSAEQDRLGRARAASALCAVLDNPSVQTPLTIGVLGGWGTGKTSLMRLIEREMERRAATRGGDQDLRLWFDAWAYARQEHSLWRALLLSVAGKLRVAREVSSEADEAGLTEIQKELKDRLDELEDSLYRSQLLEEKGGVRVNWGAAPPLLADLALRIATGGLSDAAAKDGKGPFARFMDVLKGNDAREAVKLIEREQRERYIAEVRSLDQFRRAFETTLQLAGIGPASADATRPDGRTGRRLILFVDDLDRCLPEDAVAAIEAIKLFLELPGCVFVLGMDPQVVEAGIGVRYRRGEGTLPFDPADYLDKVIQLPFRLPPPSAGQLSALLAELADQDPSGMIADVAEMTLAALPPNPRSLKRVLNVLLLAAHLEGSAEAGPTENATRRRLLAKMVFLQTLHWQTYKIATRDGISGLVDLEDAARGRAERTSEQLAEELKDKAVKALMKIEPHFGAIKDAEALARLAGLTEFVQARE